MIEALFVTLYSIQPLVYGVRWKKLLEFQILH